MWFCGLYTHMNIWLETQTRDLLNLPTKPLNILIICLLNVSPANFLLHMCFIIAVGCIRHGSDIWKTESQTYHVITGPELWMRDIMIKAETCDGTKQTICSKYMVATTSISCSGYINISMAWRESCNVNPTVYFSWDNWTLTYEHHNELPNYLWIGTSALTRTFIWPVFKLKTSLKLLKLYILINNTQMYC